MLLSAFCIKSSQKANFLELAFLMVLFTPLTALGAHSSLAIDESDPKAWVQLMSEKTSEVELDGYFTYERHSHSSSYRYIRQVVDGEERQRLIFMDGETLELMYEDGVLRCLHPKDQVSHKLRSAEIKSIFNVRKDFSHVWENYDGIFLEDTRIAGRWVKVIKLNPKDAYRFPYVFAIDAEKGVLLKMLVSDKNDHVLERFRYVTINFDDVSNEHFHHGVDDFKVVAIDLHQAEEFSPAKAQALSESAEPLDVSAGIAWVPSGFVEKTQAVTVVEHAPIRTFSDGLSSFSVFIEPVKVESADLKTAEGISTVSGGTAVSARYSAVGDQVYQVTVIGELPLASINKISESLTLK